MEVAGRAGGKTGSDSVHTVLSKYGMIGRAYHIFEQGALRICVAILWPYGHIDARLREWYLPAVFRLRLGLTNVCVLGKVLSCIFKKVFCIRFFLMEFLVLVWRRMGRGIIKGDSYKHRGVVCGTEW